MGSTGKQNAPLLGQEHDQARLSVAENRDKERRSCLIRKNAVMGLWVILDVFDENDQNSLIFTARFVNNNCTYKLPNKLLGRFSRKQSMIKVNLFMNDYNYFKISEEKKMRY